MCVQYYYYYYYYSYYYYYLIVNYSVPKEKESCIKAHNRREHSHNKS